MRITTSAEHYPENMWVYFVWSWSKHGVKAAIHAVLCVANSTYATFRHCIVLKVRRRDKRVVHYEELGQP